MIPLKRQWRLTEEQRVLAAENWPLARSLAKSIKRTFPWLADEIEGSVAQALVEAAGTFDPCRDVAFRTFARHRILGALRDCLRKELPLGTRRARKVGYQPRFVRVDRKKIEISGRTLNMTHEPPVGSELETTEVVDRHLRSLPHKYGMVCRLIYLDGRTLGEVAELLNLSVARVSRLHSQALDMLAEDFSRRLKIENETENDESRRRRSKISAAFSVSSN
jgi:RNA polymerase sigma factor (sigma-70 family)